MSYQHRQSPKQQVSQFGRVFLHAVFVTAVAMFAMAALFVPILSDLGVISAISEGIGREPYVPFFVTSWISLSLYLTSLNVGPDSEGLSGDAEDTDEEDLEGEDDDFLKTMKQATEEIFEGLASLAYLSLLVVTGSLISAYVTSHYAPVFGIVIAMALPIMESKISGTAVWFLSPSALLAFPTLVALIPVTVLMVVGAFSVGMVVAISQSLHDKLVTLGEWTIETLQVSSVDIPALDPFQRTFNRRGRH